MSAEKIPGWMSAKVARLAGERARRENVNLADALALLEGEAFTTIRGEMAANPELARMLPSAFVRNINTGAFGALSAFELSCAVIVDADAQVAAAVAGPDDVTEFTALKFRSLDDLLRAEGGDE